MHIILMHACNHVGMYVYVYAHSDSSYLHLKTIQW